MDTENKKVEVKDAEVVSEITKEQAQADFEARATKVRLALDELMKKEDIDHIAEMRYSTQGIVPVPVFSDKKQTA